MNINKNVEQLIESRLQELWNESDALCVTTKRYNEIVDEILCIRNYCRVNGIKLLPSIEARF